MKLLPMLVRSNDIRPNDVILGGEKTGTRQVNTVEVLETVVRVRFVDGGGMDFYHSTNPTTRILREQGE
jgi:hypothetical protein